MAERSPIHKVNSVTKPMLIFHGANDVRCKVAQSDTIVEAMQGKRSRSCSGSIPSPDRRPSRHAFPRK
ncbi:hypothetical protein PR017_24420 (plasmid) [Rhizobium tumorigenes]|uniref:Peptidase S9 prolyl oligopeptidase catalytic domain-containing protein n=1 Tax=Rhizobium tumorigenes TaxID=2041385 RepID=A0AAF1KJD3_9HYPH|nr:prolyl oligopeptidase family serine peptidase [Rhizobium tumorigenes]WFR98837.1 hypothetical protein PR017_24420 [Rhizobium tumorigenes]